MINSLQLIRNVGQFDSVNAGAALTFQKLTLIYAENGRGKTTLASIMRSLGSGDAVAISERKRLAAPHTPHVVVDCVGGPPHAMFQNGSWNRNLPDLCVFDDSFVDANVHSGLVVHADHRKNLHELILGAQGVALSRTLQQCAERIERHNSDLRAKAAAIPVAVRGGLSVDDFCALPKQAQIDDAIQAAEQTLAAVRQQEAIQTTPVFESIALPAIDAASIEALLTRDLDSLDATAVAELQTHLASIGENGESWLADGMSRISDSNECPFCSQDLDGTRLVEHYRAYFSDAYSDLKREVAEITAAFRRDHGGDVHAGFERRFRATTDRRTFWAQFTEMPAVEVDTAEIERDWKLARELVLAAFEQKAKAPLEKVSLSQQATDAIDTFNGHRQIVEQLSHSLVALNQSIEIVKEKAQSGDLVTAQADVARLKATKARHEPATDTACREYLVEKAAKLQTETQKATAQSSLDQYRTTTFPGFQAAINTYLGRFNAGFRLDQVTSALTRGGPTCTYSVLINNNPISVAARENPGEPSFRTALSAGDRNTLALAFFFASLDQDPNLAQKIVVIDDPVSSLDDHRSLTTVQEVRRLAARASQVVVLSHNKRFLCNIWEGADRNARTAIVVARDGNGSTLQQWNVADDCITEHDRRHRLLRDYHSNGTGDARAVATAIRPLLEAFCRVAYPEQFQPGTLLGPFRGVCEQRVGTADEILNQADIDELRDLIDYANRFHHDTNLAYDTEVINDGELGGFVSRALEFTKR
ncbi:AAA family ATPase [Thalassoglobus sp.]|uniref:AAA family ATPase n=1 Tax=Thalassoglobus sp. TaxID=2795869 RepID=UPI003AA84A02